MVYFVFSILQPDIGNGVLSPDDSALVKFFHVIVIVTISQPL